MAGRHEHRVAADPGETDAAWSVFLQHRGVLQGSAEPDCLRWICSLRRATGADVAALCLLGSSPRIVTSISSAAGPAGGQAAGSAGASRELAASETLQAHLLGLTRVAGGGGHDGEPAPPAYLEAAVIIGGLAVGQVAIAGPGEPGWPPGTTDAVLDAAAAVSAQLALRLAESEIQRVRQLVTSHHQVHDMIARAAPLRDVLTAICEVIERYDPSILPSVLLLDPVSRTLHSGVGPSLPAEYLAASKGVVIGPTIGTCGAAAWFGELAVTRSIAEDPRWEPSRHLAVQAGVNCCWSMPIKSADGEVLGTLAFYGRQPREPLAEHLALMADWSRVAGIAIERSQSVERLVYDARHDALTGLPNRAAIFEELDEAIQRATPQAPAAVLFIDLDGLKALNDALGHDRADEMIREISRRLAGAVGETGFVGRFGGDEFVVIAESLAGPAQAGDLGASLLEVVARPLPGPGAVGVTASVGIALVRTNAIEAREAIRRSDAAMYEAKRTGRDRCVFSEAGHPVQEGRRLRLARLLRGAEVRGELSLAFQPIVALPQLEVVGVEALLRWSLPGFGAVPPSEFVPIAEDTGSMVPIGAWALRESCEALARLAGSGHELDLGVNVSARQVANPDFPLWVSKTLSHAQVPPGRLTLEITETALIRPDALTATSLGELGALGVRLVLDDFGTGHSSLSWLKQHRLDGIKIDRSFIQGLPGDRGDRAIVSGVIGMAQALGYRVAAEGVETRGQLDALEALGCERVQGFLLGEPVPEKELHTMLGALAPWKAALSVR